MSLPTAGNVTLVPATPEHPEQAAELIHATEPHIFGYLHGHDMALVRRHLGHQWQQPDSIFSHRFCTAAMHGGDLVGIELGFNRAQQEAAAEPMVRYAMAVMTEEELEPLVRWSEYGRFVLPPVPDDTWYLQHLAVTDAARGRGVGEQLLTNAVERARGEGYGRIHLDVYAENPAVRLYERMGFVVIVETLVRPLLVEGIPLHFRMELRL